jgi:hypothetical protein
VCGAAVHDGHHWVVIIECSSGPSIAGMVKGVSLVHHTIIGVLQLFYEGCFPPKQEKKAQLEFMENMAQMADYEGN